MACNVRKSYLTQRPEYFEKSAFVCFAYRDDNIMRGAPVLYS